MNWCKLGFHKFVYTPAEYATPDQKVSAFYTVPSKRKCVRCGKSQWREEHCLGYHPPQYVYTWLDGEGL